MAEESKTKGKEPRKKPLSRERILAAATSMADAEGVAKLSMRKLAAQLGVEAMALYRYFAGKQQLLDAMVAAVFAEIGWQADQGAAGDRWQQQLTRRCQAMRAALLRHPWCIRLMDTQLEPEEAILSHHEGVLSVMRGAGFSRRLAADTYVWLDSFVYGFVLQELQLPATTPDDFAAIAEAAISRMPAERYPHLRDMTEHYYLKADYVFAESFERGLSALLATTAKALADEQQSSEQ